MFDLNVISVLHLFGLVQALILIFVLLLPKYRHGANHLLLILVLLFAVGLWEAFLHSSLLYRQVPALVGWFSFTPFLLGPVLFAYVKQLTGDRSWGMRKWIIHALPAAIFFLLVLPIVLEDPAHKLERLSLADQIPIEQLHPVNWLFIILRLGSLTAYTFASVKHILSLEKHWHDRSADTRLEILSWLKKLCFLFAIFLFLLLCMVFVELMGIHIPNVTYDDIALLVIATMILMIVFWGLSHPEIFKLESNISTSENPESQRYQKSGLSKSAGKILAQQILTTLADKQLYLEPKLTLADLAKAVDTSPHLVSQAINESLSTNFYTLVNGLRVKESHRRLTLAQYAHLTVERIAYDCGFNNRVSFNNAFKTAYKTTPSKCRNLIKNKE